MEDRALRNAEIDMALLRSGPFADLPEGTLAALGMAAQRRAVTAGNSLFHQGDDPTRLHLVASGTVKIWQVNSQGNQHTLRLMRRGDVIGCAAVVNRFAYPATATAEEDSETVSWTATALQTMMERHPDLTVALLRVASDRARSLVSRLGDSTAKSAEQRIAAALVRLARQSGSKCPTGIEIKFKATLQDLSQMSGVAYFTVSRMLSEWRRSGLIDNDRRRLIVQKPHDLVKIAGID